MLSMKHVLWLLPILLLAGCGNGDTADHPDAEIYQVRGRVVEILYNGEALRIDHEPIEGYMDAMRMNFRLEDPSESNLVQPGDLVRFEYVVGPISETIRQIHLLPPGTQLDLDRIAPAEADGQ